MKKVYQHTFSCILNIRYACKIHYMKASRYFNKVPEKIRWKGATLPEKNEIKLFSARPFYIVQNEIRNPTLSKICSHQRCYFVNFAPISLIHCTSRNKNILRKIYITPISCTMLITQSHTKLLS